MRSAQFEVGSLECKALRACFDLLYEEFMALHVLTAIQRAESCGWILAANSPECKGSTYCILKTWAISAENSMSVISF